MKKSLLAADQVIVPSLVFFEVFRKIVQKTTESDALLAMGVLSKYEPSPLDRTTSLLAADLSMEHNLGMADSIILAHALAAQAVLLTLDNDFSSIKEATVIR